MARKTKTKAADGRDLRARVVDAALDLAEKGEWPDATMAAVAREAEADLGDVLAAFPCKSAIVHGLLARVDEQVMAAWRDTAFEDEPPRDRLFDVLMRRFDALAPRKAGVRALIEGLRDDPLAALAWGPRFLQSMAWMLEAAGVSADGARGALRVPGLGAVYLRAFRVWLHDDSPDMARTMAALDKGLGRAERAERFFCGLSPRRRRRRETPDKTADAP